MFLDIIVASLTHYEYLKSLRFLFKTSLGSVVEAQIQKSAYCIIYITTSVKIQLILKRT